MGSMCSCVRACVRACVRGCVRACNLVSLQRMFSMPLLSTFAMQITVYIFYSLPFLKTIFNKIYKIAVHGTPQMAADKEAITLSGVYSYYSTCDLPLF